MKEWKDAVIWICSGESGSWLRTAVIVGAIYSSMAASMLIGVCLVIAGSYPEDEPAKESSRG